MSQKPAIPDIASAQRNPLLFYRATKEFIEAMAGRRSGRIVPLTAQSTATDVVNTVNALLGAVQDTAAAPLQADPISANGFMSASDKTKLDGLRPKLTVVKANATTTTETVVAQIAIPANTITTGASIRASVRFQAAGTATCIWRLRCGALGTIADTLLATITTSAAQAADAQGGAEFTIQFPSTTSAIGSGFAIMQAAVLGTTTAAAATATIAPAGVVYVDVTMQLSAAQASVTQAVFAAWGDQ